jgi:RimJ/RimL family protein N-acetyltransferase
MAPGSSLGPFVIAPIARLDSRSMADTSTPRLVTERLVLDPLGIADAAEMTAVLSDPELYEFTGGEPPSRGQLEARYARWVAGKSADGAERWHNWVVRRLGDGVAVGTVQATVYVERSMADIAWMIGRPWEGQGFASEAARALVGWLVDTGLEAITAHVHPENLASAEVARRAGLLATDELVDGEVVWRR